MQQLQLNVLLSIQIENLIQLIVGLIQRTALAIPKGVPHLSPGIRITDNDYSYFVMF